MSTSRNRNTCSFIQWTSALRINWKFCEQILWQRKFSSLVYVLQCTIRYQAFKMTEKIWISNTKSLGIETIGSLIKNLFVIFRCWKNCANGTKQTIYIEIWINRILAFFYLLSLFAQTAVLQLCFTSYADALGYSNYNGGWTLIGNKEHFLFVRVRNPNFFIWSPLLVRFVSFLCGKMLPGS